MSEAEANPRVTFVQIEERNQYPTAASFQYTLRVVTRHPDNVYEVPAGSHRSVDLAREHVRETLRKQVEFHRQQAEGYAQQLARVDKAVVDPGPVGPELEKCYADLVARFKAYAATGEPPRYPLHRLGRLTLELGYMRTPDLLVFNVPEYDCVAYTFDSETVQLILRAVAEVFPGVTTTHWNGEGTYTFSVRLAAGTINPSDKKVTANDW